MKNNPFARYAPQLLIVAVVLIGYGYMFTGFFAHDDFEWLTLAKQIADGQMPSSAQTVGFFRVCVAIVMALWVKVFGFLPWAHYGLKILIHIANVLLIYHIANTFLKERAAAMLAGLAFALSALTGEAITFYSALTDQLAFLFFAASLYCFLRPERHYLHLISAWLLYFLALTSKETAVFLPLLTLTISFLWKKQKLTAALRENSGYLALMVIYLLFYFLALPTQYFIATGRYHLSWGLPASLCQNLVIFFINPYFSLARLEVDRILALKISILPVLALFLLFYFIAVGQKKTRNTIAIPLIALIWMIVGELAFLPLIGGEIAPSRYLYLAGGGFAILLAWLISRLWKERVWVVVTLFSALYLFPNLVLGWIQEERALSEQAEYQQLLSEVKKLAPPPGSVVVLKGVAESIEEGVVHGEHPATMLKLLGPPQFDYVIASEGEVEPRGENVYYLTIKSP
jgi:hypothetical protein